MYPGDTFTTIKKIVHFYQQSLESDCFSLFSCFLLFSLLLRKKCWQNSMHVRFCIFFFFLRRTNEIFFLSFHSSSLLALGEVSTCGYNDDEDDVPFIICFQTQFKRPIKLCEHQTVRFFRGMCRTIATTTSTNDDRQWWLLFSPASNLSTKTLSEQLNVWRPYWFC